MAIVLTLGAIYAGARQTEVPKPDVVVKGRYESEGGLKVEGMGVCSITAEQVDCWDLAGARDPALTEKIRAYYLMNSNTEVGFRFGKKNRFLVLRRSPSSGHVQYQTEAGGYLSSQQISGQQGEPTLEWIRIAEETPATEAAVLATMAAPSPQPLDFAFRRGARYAFEGGAIEIGPWQPLPADRQPRRDFDPRMPQGKLWSVVLGHEFPQGPRAYFGYSPLDGRGRPIRYVDRKGEPVSDIEYLRAYPSHPNPSYFTPASRSDMKYLPALFNLTGPSAGTAVTATTNVNPGRIGFLRVTQTHQKRVLIQGFPLDPKG